MEKKVKPINIPEEVKLRNVTCNINDMAEKTISAQVYMDASSGEASFVDGSGNPWAVEFCGERYVITIREPQAAKDTDSMSYIADVTFVNEAIHELSRYFFVTVAQTAAGTYIANKYIASVSLGLADFCDLLSQVLELYYGDRFTVDLANGITTESVSVEIKYSFIFDVIKNIYKLFGVRWEIVGTEDGKYSIRIGYKAKEVSHQFKYGYEGGLIKIERQVQDSSIKNVLLGRGGTKNIPYRYFKKKDDDNPSFAGDPDWIPELESIVFDKLRDSNFRNYVRGWKARHYGGTRYEETPAYLKGYNDDVFSPIEYVRDEESIARYGELWGSIEDNEDIFPTIQGVVLKDYGRIDEAVAVERIETDEIKETASDTAIIQNISTDGCRITETVDKGGYKDFTLKTDYVVFVPEHRIGNIDIDVKAVFQETRRGEETNQPIVEKPISVRLYDRQGNEYPAVGISTGTYRIEIAAKINNSDKSKERKITAYPTGARLEYDFEKPRFTNTWDIWIKNVFDTQKGATESEEAYKERVWGAVLGSSDGNNAAVMFSDGMLSLSEDYEFIISDVHYDTTMSFQGVPSHWRLTLSKSDADLDATGLYLPSTQTHAEAGDHFFFTGIDMPHLYVLLAEERLTEYKEGQLGKAKAPRPTWVVSLDKVKIGNEGKAGALIDDIDAGAYVSLYDDVLIHAFEGVASERLFIKSVTYKFSDGNSSGDSSSVSIVPDVEIVLSDNYDEGDNPVTMLQGSVEKLSNQVSGFGNIENAIRAICDRIYLRKDGFTDESYSPTSFHSLVTSNDFRSGMLGGSGWGIFKDANGNWVIEADRVNVRQEMQVNDLIINQAKYRGGMFVESAASMEVTMVLTESNGDFSCYFDQKEGTVANMFVVDDVALCIRYDAENNRTKFYKRRVVAVGVDSITLSDEYVNGDGVPEVGDNIVQYGNYTEARRRFVKVSDVIGGGYDRFIEGLSSVNSDGTEYFFVGRQDGQYGNKPRFFLGNKDNFIEFIEGKLNVNAVLSVKTKVGDTAIGDYIADEASKNATCYLDIVGDVLPIPCDSEGRPTSELPKSHLIVYQGSKLDTGWDFILSTEGCTAELIDEWIYIRSITADNAEVLVLGKKSGKADLDGRISLYKVIPGANGSPGVPGKPGENGADGTDGENAVFYDIDVSPDNISKYFTETLSASSVECTKVKVDGDIRSATTHKILKYQRIGTDNNEILGSSEGENAKVTVNVSKENTAVIFTLYDTDASTILARKRVPILRDASDMALSARNLLSNSRKLTIKSSDSNFNHVAFTIPYEIMAGEYLALSVGSIVNVEGNASDYSVSVYDETISEEICPIQRISNTSNTCLFKATKNSGENPKLIVYAGRAGSTAGNSVTYNRMTLVFGNVPMLTWTPSVEEVDAGIDQYAYIKTALGESTDIIGGLILTSLIRLGVKTINGFDVRAGISGILKEGNNERDIAVWAGGEQIDAAEVEDPNSATFAIRQDGSAYAAKNTVRFEQDRVMVGNNVKLDKYGLQLMNEDEEKLSIQNVSVSELADRIGMNKVTINKNADAPDMKVYKFGGVFPPPIEEAVPFSVNVPIVPGEPSYPAKFQFGVYTDGFTQEIPLGTFTKHTSFDLSFVIDLGFAVSSYTNASNPEQVAVEVFNGTYTVELVENGIVTLSSTFYDRHAGDDSHTGHIVISKFSMMAITMYDNSDVSVRVKLNKNYSSDIHSLAMEVTAHPYTSVSGSAKYGIAEKTILGNDGTISVWGENILMIDKSGIIMRNESYGLSIKADGVKKYVNGTWLPANI